ncbi:MAG: DnaA N-terminal domain-containing protein [Persicimonas sp.]
MAPYQPDPVVYVEDRIDEGILDRIEATTLLVKVLAEDAERDAVRRPSTVDAEPRTVHRRTDTDDEADQVTEDPPGPPLEDYEHPPEWATALEALRQRISSHNYTRWFEPLRAEATDEGLVLWTGDGFDAMWLRDEWLDVLESVVDVAAIRPSDTDQRGAA